MLSQHIPTIEKIYKAQPESASNRQNFQSQIQTHPFSNSNLQTQHQLYAGGTHSNKQRQLIPKIKKSITSKNQYNQFKQVHALIPYGSEISRNNLNQNHGQTYSTQDANRINNQGINYPGMVNHQAPFHQASSLLDSLSAVGFVSGHHPLSQTQIPSVSQSLNFARSSSNHKGDSQMLQSTSNLQQAYYPTQQNSQSNQSLNQIASQKSRNTNATHQLTEDHISSHPDLLSTGSLPFQQATSSLNNIKVKNKLLMPSSGQAARMTSSGSSSQLHQQPIPSRGSKNLISTAPLSNALGTAGAPNDHSESGYKGLEGAEGLRSKKIPGAGLQTSSSHGDLVKGSQRYGKNAAYGMRPKSVKSKQGADQLGNQAQQTGIIAQKQFLAKEQSNQTYQKNNGDSKGQFEQSIRNDDNQPSSHNGSTIRPFQGQGAQKNQTPDLLLNQEPNKPTIPSNFNINAANNNQSQFNTSQQNQELVQASNANQGVGSGNKNIKVKSENNQAASQTDSQQTASQNNSVKQKFGGGISSSSLASGQQANLLSSKLKETHQKIAGYSQNTQNQNKRSNLSNPMDLNSKDIMKRIREDAKKQDQAAVNTDIATNSDNRKGKQIQSKPQKTPKDVNDENALEENRKNIRKNMRSLDSNGQKTKQKDAENKNDCSQQKSEQDSGQSSAISACKKDETGTSSSSPQKNKQSEKEQPKVSILQQIRHPLKEYYNKLHQDLQAIDNFSVKTQVKGSQFSSLNKQPLDPLKITRESNLKGEDITNSKNNVSKQIFSEKKSKISDYLFGYAGHGGISADRMSPLQYMSHCSTCQGIKEHPKTSNQTSLPQHSKCSFFSLIETIQCSSNKRVKLDQSQITRQQESIAKLIAKLQENVLSNKNFLNNPTDALAEGLNVLRQEAIDNSKSDKKSPEIGVNGKEIQIQTTSLKDTQQDFIKVREQNLGSLDQKDGQIKQGQNLPSQLVAIVIIDDICLCANIGSCRAIMSSKGGGRLYCLNMEHTVPGNEIEEKRILAQMARHKKQAKTPQEHAFCRDALTEYIATINLPQTRMVGPVPPRDHSTDFKKQKYDKLLDQLQSELIISDPDITAIQLTDQEEFIIIGTSGLFKRLQGQDLQNIVWQRALILGIRKRLAGVKDVKLDPSQLSEAMLQMAYLKKCQGNLGALIVLFPIFHTLLNKFLDIIMQAQTQITNEKDIQIDFGALRVLYKNPELLKFTNFKHEQNQSHSNQKSNGQTSSNLPSMALVEHLVEVDEIELEPIPLNDESEKQYGSEKAYEDTYRMLNQADEQAVQDNIDEIIYSHGSFAGLIGNQAAGARRQGFNSGRGIYGGRGIAANMLSSIPEESSIREMDVNSSSIVTDQNMQCFNNSYEKIDKDLQSLVVPQSSQEPTDEIEDVNVLSSGSSKKNHRRFGKNATKFMGTAAPNYDNKIKTLEEVTNELEDLRVQTPPDLANPSASPSKPGQSPEGAQAILPSSVQFGNGQELQTETVSLDFKNPKAAGEHP